ncbi:predicted branched-chain amino acid permease (Azaleucine resistance) [Clostridium sp. CAG:299]|mgnify:CR=1 FL=1|nr:predicted branched-chain amino acid permease (Azaleucine resistance) [Clostridium sp. CAG:299]
MDWRREFKKGIKSGLPIGIGYIPVSFTFGFLAVSGGLPIWVAVVISLTNLTSAGQFAGTNLIFAGAGYLEVALTTFVINIRYMLMSLSLSQKLERKTGTLARLALAFGITDETFVVGSLKPGTLTAPFMLGLILMPVAGWNLGTLMGGCISTLLPQALQNAMGIALYAMFIALIIPAAKASAHVLCIICIAVAVQCGLNYIPVFSFLSDGFRVIISTVAAAGLGAWLFPGTDDSGETEKIEKIEKIEDAADEAAEETAKETDGKMREKAQETGGDSNGA